MHHSVRLEGIKNLARRERKAYHVSNYTDTNVIAIVNIEGNESH